MEDYGHIDKDTPSLAISLLPEYRDQGIGTKLLSNLLSLLYEKGFHQVSLSVQRKILLFTCTKSRIPNFRGKRHRVFNASEISLFEN